MNKKQMIILWIGIAIFTFFAVCSNVDSSRRMLGQPEGWGWMQNFAVLIVRWAVLSVITAGAIYSLKDSKDKNKTEPKT